VQREFWLLIRTGLSTEDAAGGAGVSVTSGRRWFREAGGMCPPRFVPSGRYLSLAEREDLAAAHAAGEGVRQIAERLGRSPSTVSRELRRNSSFRGHRFYRPSIAQAKAELRARRPKEGKLATRPALCLAVQKGLTKKWSPEQISADLRISFPDDERMQVSHEAIYQALYVQGRGGLRRELTVCLRTGRALRKPRRRAGERREHIKNKVMISERPAEVADRAVPGHWEGDLITGANNATAIGTLVERTTRFTMLLHLPDDHGAEAVEDAITATIATLPVQLRRSLTWDQGLELSRHAEITIAADLPIYFCDPHSPWQRGSNENTNGLLRQYFPKGTNLSRHTPAELAAVAAELNARPRKTLGWKSPAQTLQALLSDPSSQPSVATTT
jgi:IS30 family transposase